MHNVMSINGFNASEVKDYRKSVLPHASLTRERAEDVQPSTARVRTIKASMIILMSLGVSF